MNLVDSTSAKPNQTITGKRSRLETELKVEEDRGGGGGREPITVVANSFFNEFVDCMQNLPNRLQALFTELSAVDALVRKRHRTLQAIKRELTQRTTNQPTPEAETEQPDEETAEVTKAFKTQGLDELLVRLHQTLIDCQNLGDHKVRITSQIIETICSKTRPLGLDCKSNDERKFNFELNEERILAEFKQAVRKTRPVHNCFLNTSAPGGVNNNNNSRTSTRNSSQQNLIASKPATKSLLEMSTKYHTSKSSPNHDAYAFESESSSTLSTASHSINGVNKSLKIINNIMNSSGKKTAARPFGGKVAVCESNSPNVNGKRGVKKFKVDDDHENENFRKTDASGNTRPKRQLNYSTNNGTSPTKQSSSQSLATNGCGGGSSSSSSSSSMHHHHNHHHHQHINSKKRRLSHHYQVKSNQCRSPSSLSTTSTSSSNQVAANCKANKTGSSYMLLSRASKIHQMAKKQAKSDEQQAMKKTGPKKLKTNPRQAGKKLSNKVSKLNGGHKSTGEDENENENEEDDDDDDEDDDVSLSNDEIEMEQVEPDEDGDGEEDDDDDDEQGTTQHRKQSRFDAVASSRGTRLHSDDSNSSLGPSNKLESDMDEIKPPNSSSNETESIKQLDDDENEFGSKMIEKEIKTWSNKPSAHQKDDHKAMKCEAAESSEAVPSNAHNSENTGESGKKKPSRNSASFKSINLNSDASSVGGAGAAAAASSATPSTSNHRQMNEDEPLYCLCREISYGQMIMCDNDACQIEWFHFQCVKLASKPKGKWYCPNCRGDSHRVMKKSHLMNTSSSSSMASPSYYSNYSYSTRNK